MELSLISTKDNWFHYFGSNLLGHNLDFFDDLVDIVDIVIEM